MKPQANLMEVDELSAKIGQPTLRIVDCRFNLMQPNRGRQEYLSGHIPGAAYADLNEDLASAISEKSGRHPLPEPQTFRDFLGQCGIDRRSEVVIYDQNNGALALRLWWLLAWQGHDRVWLLNGGIDRWLQCGQDLKAGTEAQVPARFSGESDDSLTLTTQQILDGLEEAEPLLLFDARSAERFLGQSEPIDTVAGHIPGAVNFPLQRSLDGDGRWLTPDLLRARWREVLGDEPDVPFGVMCGSGVTACHLVFSACYAGLRTPVLYVGSWSEWIRDRSRPIAAGHVSGPADSG